MSFDTLSERLKEVAGKSLAYCRLKYGSNGIKVEEGIADAILWRPTFYLKPSKFRIVAVEVEDNLYPSSLRGAAHDISHYDIPISVFQACSLEAYQADQKHKMVNRLKEHGFGIITVDEDGNVAIQHNCVPIAQHISPDAFARELNGLVPSIKVSFRTAYDVYNTNEGQGLQEAGQIVEGIVASFAKTAVSKNALSDANILKRPLAEQIDALYATNVFKNHRAALGGARDFIKEFRNTASHPPKTAKQAAEKIRNCRVGFLDAMSIVRKLTVVAKELKYPIKVYTT